MLPPRVPIGLNSVLDSYNGRKVLAYWEGDQQWYEATLTAVSVDIGPLEFGSVEPHGSWNI